MNTIIYRISKTLSIIVCIILCVATTIGALYVIKSNSNTMKENEEKCKTMAPDHCEDVPSCVTSTFLGNYECTYNGDTGMIVVLCIIFVPIYACICGGNCLVMEWLNKLRHEDYEVLP